MVFHENRLHADDSQERAYLIFLVQSLSSAAVVICALMWLIYKQVLRVQRCERFRALVVLVSGFTHYE